MRGMIIIYFEYEDEIVAKLFNDLNDVIHSKKLLQKKIGLELTRLIKKRYNQIHSCNSFYEIQKFGLGKIESLSGNLKGYYSIRLDANYRLVFKPKSNDLTVESLKNCDTVIIKGVIDYHGKGNNWIIP